MYRSSESGTLRFIISGGGGQIKWGDFKDFEKLINGRININRGGVGPKYKREETKIGLSLNTLLRYF